MGFKSEILHLRCAEMQDQAGAIDWDDFRFVLAIVRGGRSAVISVHLPPV